MEQALWRLYEKPVAEVSLKTDRMKSSDRIKAFKTLATELDGEDWHELVENFCDAADNILVIRNTIGHGYIAGKSSINNPTWNGEVRKREGQIIHIDQQTMGLTLDSLFELIVFIREVQTGNETPNCNPKLLSRELQLRKAYSYTGEVRHLHALMNHEKN